MNLTVWQSVESLRGFVYRTAHLEPMRRRREWFVPLDRPHLVLWWIPAGVLPTTAEAGERLDLLRRGRPVVADGHRVLQGSREAHGIGRVDLGDAQVGDVQDRRGIGDDDLAVA